jgi:beta-galactosidase
LLAERDQVESKNKTQELKPIFGAGVWAIAFLLVFASHDAWGQRTVLPLAAGWRFHLGEIPGGLPAAADDTGWEQVSVPHSWSNAEAVPGMGFYAGDSWYSERFTAQPGWRSDRVFLRFEAVSLVAEVFLNGKRLGEHHGGFAAFVYEISGSLDFAGENRLVVRVNNKRRPDVSPLGGDFTIYGGIYRPVSLIITGAVNITPLDYASPGVFLKQSAVSRAKAVVDAETEVSNGETKTVRASVRLTLLDSNGNRVLTRSADATLNAGKTGRVAINFAVFHPHLWNGVADAYLYHVRVDLLEHGKIVDTTTQPLGLRSFKVDAARGFLLNGVPSQIHGVCLHQEFDSHGWAVTPAEEMEDIRIMREMGVNGIRLVHYQHSQSFLDAADHEGLLIWAELTQIDHVNGTPEYHDNIRQQLIELIRQNYNHPSIFVWSLYNELNSPTKALSTPLIVELNQLAHAEDPARPTTGAASGDTIANLHEMVASADLISDNNYAGWYGKRPEDLGPEIDKWNAAYDHRGLSISEYGGGASIHDHKQNIVPGEVQPGGRFHPEEWQSSVHEGNYLAIASRPEVWGSFAWVMFDFASIGRHEGDIDGVNDKGLVTRDRATRKDAYFFYQANWAAKPMVYITSRRDSVRSQAATYVKVYSNRSNVSLEVNGKAMGAPLQPQPHVFLWKDIELSEGENRIHADAEGGATDDCVWIYTDPKPPSP